MLQQSMQYRVRITFGKNDALRFIGHLDLAKLWERVLRRAEMPLVYSQGYNPQPKMQLASALPLGISSDCELLDIWLLEPVNLETLPERLNAVSPPGLHTYRVQEVPPKAPALQTLLHSADYLITLAEEVTPDLPQRIADLLSRERIERERRGKSYDLRPLILALEPVDTRAFRVRLALGAEGTARPDELMDAMGLSFDHARCHRQALNLVGTDEQEAG